MTDELSAQHSEVDPGQAAHAPLDPAAVAASADGAVIAPGTGSATAPGTRAGAGPGARDAVGTPDQPGAAQVGNPGLGIALCIAAILLFACQDAITRYLVQDLAVAQILTIRFAGFALLGLAYAVWRLGVGAALRSKRPGAQFVRSALLLIEIAIFTLGLRFLGLADMHAVFATFPLIVTALAAPLLGEQVGWRRWLAVGVGLAGTLVILRPGTGVFEVAALLPLLAAFMFALYTVLTRRVARHDRAEVSLAWTGVVAFALVLPFGIAAWSPLAGDQPFWLGILILTSTGGHFLLISALVHAQAATLQPLNYLLLVFATAVGFVVFGELPDGWTMIGAAVVVASGLFVLFRERARARGAERAGRN
ncbi:MAG: DMT family transporter [Pseudomonadota bacterium]